MIKDIEMNELQLFVYYQFISLVENPTEVVLAEFTIKSPKHLDTLFRVNFLLGTGMNIKGATATVAINLEILGRLIILCESHPELIKAL